MFESKLQRNLSYLVFGIYLALLVWLVLFKFAVSLEDVSRIRGLNLIPFYYDTEVGFALHAKEVIYNILVFVPLGVYVCIFCPDWGFLKKCLPGFVLSLVFETLQYILAIGATDITDLIGNTAGGVLGIAVFAVLRRLFPRRCITVVNGLGAGIELLGLVLLGIVIAANM